MANKSSLYNLLTPSVPKPPTQSVPSVDDVKLNVGQTPETEQATSDGSSRRSNLMKQLLTPKKEVVTETEQPTVENENESVLQPIDGDIGDYDMVTQLPKLSTNQIMKAIQGTSFAKSSAFNNQLAAEGIYNAQQKTGLSALAILGIAALESGWGTSNIGSAKGNYWGYGAINSNPMGGAHTYGSLQNGATNFASEFLRDYYNGYGAKTINSVGTGNNPAGKGYAYYDNGGINSSWATNVSKIMNALYNAAR